MTRHSNLRDFIDLAFARSTPLCRARFGELMVEVSTDERTAELGFQQALLPTDAVADTSFAVLSGEQEAFLPMVPEQSDTEPVLQGNRARLAEQLAAAGCALKTLTVEHDGDA